MRQILAVRGQVAFAPENVRAEIEEVASHFGGYLAKTRRGGTNSKHSALGAVGKALRHAASGARGDALLGYARRVHEQTTGTTFPAGTVEELDAGLLKLGALLDREDVPARAQAEILTRVDYATYYQLRRRDIERLREYRAKWQSFVRQHGAELGLDMPKALAMEWVSKKRISALSAAAWEKFKEWTDLTQLDEEEDDHG